MSQTKDTNPATPKPEPVKDSPKVDKAALEASKASKQKALTEQQTVRK
jgi:hypothetical protein